MNFDSLGDPVLTSEPDIFFDDPEPDAAPRIDDLSLLLAVTFELGRWAAQDKIKSFAARSVLRQENQSAANFAKENKVSGSFVRRRIREARAFIGSAVEVDK